MNGRNIPTIFALTFALACEQVPDTDIGETGTDTGTDTATVGDSSSDSDTGSDTGSPADMWLLVDSADVIVGELASPDASEWTNHEDMFAPDLPGVAYVTRSDDEGNVWGFNFNGWEGGLTIEHDVWFESEDCTGTASTRFVTVKQTGNSPSQADCELLTIESMGDGVVLHFGMPDAFADWVGWRWPGADGAVGRRSPTGQWYGIPVDQTWPEYRFSQSRRLADGTCENFMSSGCSIEVVDLGWDSMTDYADPIRLVHAIDG